jgi:hypothetical protein
MVGTGIRECSALKYREVQLQFKNSVMEIFFLNIYKHIPVWTIMDVLKIRVCKDPITNLLLGRFNYKLALIWFIFPILLILTSFYYKTLTIIELPPELSAEGVKALPLLKDRTFYSLLIVVPLVLVLLNYFFRFIPEMFVNLWENKVIQNKTGSELSLEQYNTYLKEIEERINSKKAFTLILAFMPVIIFLSLYSFYKSLSIQSPVITAYDIRYFPLCGIVFFAISIFMVFLIIPVLYKGFLLILLPRKLHKEVTITVRPLHPDNCGGLKPLGDLCIRFDYIFFVGAVGAVLYLLFSEGIEFKLYLFIFLLYGFFVTFFFYYPLWPVHKTMKAHKYDLLYALNEKLDPVYREITTSINAEALEKIEKIERIYNRVSNMPVWPFDTGGLIRFLTAVFMPLLGILAGVLS